MGKKIDRGEPKKECPSCGLGVSLEANICEFCGWDFEEEDEWILQIEKLERELLLEKQKFEPGTVNHKIESTLRSPVLERAEAAKSAPKEPDEEAAPAAQQKEVFTAEQFLDRESAPVHHRHHTPPAKAAAPEPVREPRPEPAPEPAKVRRVRNVKAPPERPVPVPERRLEPEAPAQQRAPAVRRVRQVAVKQPEPEPAPVQQPPAKVRTVRKVKG